MATRARKLVERWRRRRRMGRRSRNDCIVITDNQVDTLLSQCICNVNVNIGFLFGF